LGKFSYSKRAGVWNFVLSGSANQSQMEIKNRDIFTTSNLFQYTLMAQFKQAPSSNLHFLRTANYQSGY